MIFIYLENKPNLLSLSRDEALPALESQVLEIFSRLNSLENVILGLFIDNIVEIKIQPFNKFIWEIDIINMKNHKSINVHYSIHKVIQLIKDVFDGINPFESTKYL